MTANADKPSTLDYECCPRCNTRINFTWYGVETDYKCSKCNMGYDIDTVFYDDQIEPHENVTWYEENNE